MLLVLNYVVYYVDEEIKLTYYMCCFIQGYIAIHHPKLSCVDRVWNAIHSLKGNKDYGVEPIRLIKQPLFNYSQQHHASGLLGKPC